MKADMPRSVRAITIIRSAVAPFVAHALAPDSTHWSRSRTARVRSAAASDPDSRASSTIWRWVSERPAGSIAIDIEAPSALATEPPRRDHFPQQRRRTVLVVSQVALQHFEDRETHVQADQVGERQRAQRMVHPE